MAQSPDNSAESIGKLIGDLIGWSKRHPLLAVAMGTVYLGGITSPLWFSRLDNLIDPGQAKRVEAQERDRQAQEALSRVKQEALRKDYEETGGVDINRVPDTETFLFTITRPSAVLAGSTQEVLSRVIAKVSEETGCPSIITSVVWEDRGSNRKPTIYSATAVCPK